MQARQTQTRAEPQAQAAPAGGQDPGRPGTGGASPSGHGLSSVYLGQAPGSGAHSSPLLGPRTRPSALTPSPGCPGPSSASPHPPSFSGLLSWCSVLLWAPVSALPPPPPHAGGPTGQRFAVCRLGMRFRSHGWAGAPRAVWGGSVYLSSPHEPASSWADPRRPPVPARGHRVEATLPTPVPTVRRREMPGSRSQLSSW